jgi:hypothetical protein
MTTMSISRPRTGTPNASAPNPIGTPTSTTSTIIRHIRYESR